jgi:hypothetical protein
MPGKQSDGMSITGEKEETTESQTETVEDSSMDQTSTPTEEEFEPGGTFQSFHSDVILTGSAYQINDGLLGHRIRVEYDGKEIFNETSTDREGLEWSARDAVRRFKAEKFPEVEQEFDLG